MNHDRQNEQQEALGSVTKQKEEEKNILARCHPPFDALKTKANTTCTVGLYTNPLPIRDTSVTSKTLPNGELVPKQRYEQVVSQGFIFGSTETLIFF